MSDDSMPGRTPDSWQRLWRVESPRPPANASCHARVRLHHRGRRLRWRRPRGASERGRRSPGGAHRGRGTDGSLVNPHAGSPGFELRRRPVKLVLPQGAAEASRRPAHLSATRQSEPGRTRSEPARFLAVTADVSRIRRSSRARVPMTSSRCTQAIEARDGPLA